jgi:M6 family metalloprotease-like protein
MKTVITLLSLLLLAVAATAAPFRKNIEFRQPNGAMLVLWGEGDEFHATFETLDGYTVVFDETLAGYCYATLAPGDPQLASTGVLADSPAPAGLAQHLRLPPESVKKAVAEKRAAWDRDMEIRERWNARKAQMNSSDIQYAPPSSHTVGQKTGLTLLIDFSDVPGTIPKENVEDFCNGDNYKGYNNNGSVKQYFLDNSNGKLTYSNVVTIYIRVPQPKSYYNDTSKDAGPQGRKLIIDAIAAMKALPEYETEILPTFSALSTDSQKRVLACNVFYAGDNGGRWSYGLWPHSWVLSSAIELSPGGKKVYFYQVTDLGSRLELGTFCHENGHMLCDYPDIYDYDYGSSGGAGIFCLMNSGSSAGGGLNPTQICAYLKRASGWATTIELNAASLLTASLSATGTNFNTFYRYQKPGTSTEYYLAECRHKSHRDNSLPGSGIAIWHIDELGDHNNESLTPNTTHKNYEVTLVQADGLWDLQNKRGSGDAKDLWFLGNSAAGYQNIFSDSSKPAAKWWNGNASGLYWHSFSAAGTTMTFRVGSADAKPVFVLHPHSKAVLQDTSVDFVASVAGEDPITYQWRKEGSPLAGGTTNTFQIAAASLSDAGVYSLYASNAFGTATSSNAVLTVIPTVPLADALDYTATWSVSPAFSWYGQTNQSHDGNSAAKTFITPDGQSSALTTSVNGPCTISFWWKVSSQPDADKLSFYAGGTLLASRSGNADWRQETYYLGEGPIELSWVYSKDAALAANQDCAWVDQVVVKEGATLPYFVSQPADKTGLAGQPAIFHALASGTPPLSYNWFLQGKAIDAASSNIFAIASSATEHVGHYTVVASNPFGSVTSAPAALVIVPVASGGNNTFGQTTVPPLASNLLAVAAGAWHSLGLTLDRRVVSWGNGYNGQTFAPVSVRNVASVAAGGYHNLALKMDGTIVAWGDNSYQQASPPVGLRNCIAIAAGDTHSLALSASGVVHAWGDNTWGQCSVPGDLRGVVAIAAGGLHSLALRANGTVAAWGSNMDPQGYYAGQSIVPASLSNIVAIAAGEAHSVALRADGRVICWGSGADGQLNTPAGLTAVAISAGGSHTLAIRSSGSVAGWGANWQGQASFPSTLTNVVSVAGGRSHTLVLLGEVPTAPRALSMTHRQALTSLLIQGSPSRACSLEYADSPSSQTWTSLPSFPATGAPQLLLDTEAPGPARFYRIKQW